MTSHEHKGVLNHQQLYYLFHGWFNTKAQDYWSLVRRIYRSPVDSLHKGPSNAECVSMSWRHTKGIELSPRHVYTPCGYYDVIHSVVQNATTCDMSKTLMILNSFDLALWWHGLISVLVLLEGCHCICRVFLCSVHMMTENTLCIIDNVMCSLANVLTLIVLEGRFTNSNDINAIFGKDRYLGYDPFV